jgi:tight adherence protein B
MTPESGAAASAILVVLAVLAVPRPGAEARLRLRRLTRREEGAARTGSRATASADVVTLAEHLAVALRAGLAPARASAMLAARAGPAARTAQAALPWVEIGVPTGRALWQALRPCAGSPLVPLVVALDVCDRTGAPAAEVLDGLAAALRAQQAAADEIAVALAAPRATVRVMTALPAAGLGMAGLLGTDVVHVLVGTTAGHACLAVGGAFWAAGHWWIRRLVAAATLAGPVTTAAGPVATKAGAAEPIRRASRRAAMRRAR